MSANSRGWAQGSRSGSEAESELLDRERPNVVEKLGARTDILVVIDDEPVNPSLARHVGPRRRRRVRVRQAVSQAEVAPRAVRSCTDERGALGSDAVGAQSSRYSTKLDRSGRRMRRRTNDRHDRRHRDDGPGSRRRLLARQCRRVTSPQRGAHRRRSRGRAGGLGFQPAVPAVDVRHRHGDRDALLLAASRRPTCKRSSACSNPAARS